jgi:hypothetical protein
VSGCALRALYAFLMADFNPTVPEMDSVPLVLVPPTFAFSAPLTPSLTLFWNVVGQRLDFQAVYQGTGWCVCVAVCGKGEGEGRLVRVSVGLCMRLLARGWACKCLLASLSCMCWLCRCRIGVGISASGAMAGPATALSNAVICFLLDGTVAQFHFMNASYEGIVPDSTVGTTGMSFTQISGQTVMTWSRTVDNGNPNDAQVSVTGPTDVIWAIGKSNGRSQCTAGVVSDAHGLRGRATG